VSALRKTYDRRFWYGIAAWLIAYLLGLFAGRTGWAWWSVFLLGVVCALAFFQLLDRRERIPK